MIPFIVNSTHTPPGADRIYMFSGFLLSPTADCGQLNKPCFERRARNGLFSPDNAALEGMLNGYVPRLKPGHYGPAALQVVEVLKRGGPLSHVYGYTEPRQYVVSNAGSVTGA